MQRAFDLMCDRANDRRVQGLPLSQNGQMQRAFDLMCDRANDRRVQGLPLSQNGQIRLLIAESAADIFSHRAATLAAAEAVDRGSEARVEISLIKFRGAQLLHNVIDRAIQVHGALGVTSDTPLEWMYREARYAGSTTAPTRCTAIASLAP